MVTVIRIEKHSQLNETLVSELLTSLINQVSKWLNDRIANLRVENRW